MYKRPLIGKFVKRKPLELYFSEERDVLNRELRFRDILAIGVGGTLGTGVFVSTGMIAHVYAGPGVVLCWLISGMVCGVSSLSYAEMSSRIPSGGSTYAYSYHVFGEAAAFISAGILTLLYGVSGAAVARSWGDKMASLLSGWELDVGWAHQEYFNIFGGIIQSVCVLLLLRGITFDKTVINAFTLTKVLVVSFMICTALAHFNTNFLSPFFPAYHKFQPNPKEISDGLTTKMSFGFTGLVTGTTQAFFGYVGVDEACCMAAQTRNTLKLMPRAIITTVATVCFLSMLAGLSLCAMSPYNSISATSGFADAFVNVGWGWAAQVTYWGELCTLPVVVLITFVSQPQLQYAMAEDGLLPSIFKEVDNRGRIWWGTALGGAFTTALALFVPFTFLGGVVSVGMLAMYCVTNASVVALRGDTLENPRDVRCWLFVYMGSATLSVIFLAKNWFWVTVVMAVLTFCVLVKLCVYFVNAPVGKSEHTFEMPCVPFLPCVAIWFNFYLISSCSAESVLGLSVYSLFCFAEYGFYGLQHSKLQQNLA